MIAVLCIGLRLCSAVWMFLIMLALDSEACISTQEVGHGQYAVNLLYVLSLKSSLESTLHLEHTE